MLTLTSRKSQEGSSWAVNKMFISVIISRSTLLEALCRTGTEHQNHSQNLINPCLWMDASVVTTPDFWFCWVHSMWTGALSHQNQSVGPRVVQKPILLLGPPPCLVGPLLIKGHKTKQYILLHPSLSLRSRHLPQNKSGSAHCWDKLFH